MKILSSLLTIILFGFFFSACGSDVDCSDPANLDDNWAQELADVRTSQDEYAADPSSENCNAYKRALDVYINVLKDYKSCAENAAQEGQFNEAIEFAEDQAGLLEC